MPSRMQRACDRNQGCSVERTGMHRPAPAAADIAPVSSHPSTHGRGMPAHEKKVSAAGNGRKAKHDAMTSACAHQKAPVAGDGLGGAAGRKLGPAAEGPPKPQGDRWWDWGDRLGGSPHHLRRDPPILVPRLVAGLLEACKAFLTLCPRAAEVGARLADLQRC